MDKKTEHLMMESIIINKYTIDDLPQSIVINPNKYNKATIKRVIEGIEGLKVKLMQIESYEDMNVFDLSDIIGVPPFVCRLLINDIIYKNKN
ncbi:hypothetical protein [uncultured Mediterranean phage uvMED]|nr:hypothetical protein [uncultured Mediterranean phage uvMED]